MFGYITPERPHLFIKDEELYKALYCGVCRGIGTGCGTLARTALTYDIAFMSALLHNIKNDVVTIKKRRCPVHPFKKRNVAEVDETTVMLGCINTVLAYYKLLDDKADGDSRGILAHLFKKGYKKTLRSHPEIARIIGSYIDKQAEIEKSGCDSVDRACEPTAKMMEELSSYVLGEFATEHTRWLCYDIGKWVYLVDALDDYDKDVKKLSYNVLKNAYGAKNKAELTKANEKELKFVFNSLFADMRDRLSKIKFYYNHDLTDNIILLGIPTKTRQLFYGTDEGKGN